MTDGEGSRAGPDSTSTGEDREVGEEVPRRSEEPPTDSGSDGQPQIDFSMMPDWLVELNEEISHSAVFLREMGKHGVLRDEDMRNARRRLDILHDYLNQATTGNGGLSWWVGEGSTFARGMGSHLTALRQVDFSDRQSVQEWITNFDDALARGAESDIQTGKRVNNVEDQDLVRKFVRGEARKLADQMALLKALEGVTSVRQRVEEEASTASDAAEEAQQHAANSRLAAGETGSNSTAEHFETHAKQEAEAANAWRIATVVIFAAVAAYAVYHLAEPSGLTMSEVLARLGVATPFLALGGYCARESAQHRRFARWAGTLAVQLRTIDAFSDPLEPEERSQLRAAFGRRVFDPSPLAPTKAIEAGSDKANVETALEQVTGALRDVAQLLRRTEGGT